METFVKRRAVAFAELYIFYVELFIRYEMKQQQQQCLCSAFCEVDWVPLNKKVVRDKRRRHRRICSLVGGL